MVYANYIKIWTNYNTCLSLPLASLITASIVGSTIGSAACVTGSPISQPTSKIYYRDNINMNINIIAKHYAACFNKLNPPNGPILWIFNIIVSTHFFLGRHQTIHKKGREWCSTCRSKVLTYNCENSGSKVGAGF